MATQDEEKSHSLWTRARAKLRQHLKSCVPSLSSSATLFTSRNLDLASENRTQSFELFGNLPSEIRLNIWRLALPPPRVIVTNSEFIDDEDEIVGWDYMSRWDKYKRKKILSPKEARRLFYGVLQACGESRAEAMKFYRILVPHPEAVTTFRLPEWADPPYVNICHDIFDINPPYNRLHTFTPDMLELQIAYGDQLAMIRTISTCEIMVRDRDKGEAAYSTMQRLFPGVTKLILFFPPGGHDSCNGIIRAPFGGHAEAVSKEFQAMRAEHPEWNIRSVEVRDYDGRALRTVPGTDDQGLDLDVTYTRDRTTGY